MTSPAAPSEWADRPIARIVHYAILVLMVAAAILGGTAFDGLQIACEVALITLLGYTLLKVRHTGWDVILLVALAGTGLASALVNDFRSFALNFKLFLLCLFTLTYFRKVEFLPHRLIDALFVLNALLVVHQWVTGQFILPNPALFGYYRSYINDRPLGLFLTPHASSFFVAIWVLHRLASRPLPALLALPLMWMMASLTSVAALFAQMTDYVLRRARAYRVSFGKLPLFTFVIAPVALVFFLIDPFLELIRVNSYFRYYSVEIILPQLFDPRTFLAGLRFIPTDYVNFTVQQEATYAQFGNEIGYVKVFVEGGIVLGMLTLWALTKELKAFRVFIYVSLLHYSFVINTPFFLFLMIGFNREMTSPRRVAARASKRVRSAVLGRPIPGAP